MKFLIITQSKTENSNLFQRQNHHSMELKQKKVLLLKLPTAHHTQIAHLATHQCGGSKTDRGLSMACQCSSLSLSLSPSLSPHLSRLLSSSPSPAPVSPHLPHVS